MPNANYIFIFQISAYDPDRLLPQVRKALEKSTELLSRKRFPRMWKFTDACNGMVVGRKKSRLRTRILSGLCLALGIFLFVPGLMEPQSLLAPLIAGALAIGIGIGGLWRSRKRKHRKDPFDQPARALLAGKDAIAAEAGFSAAFSEEGMALSAPNADALCIPYSEFECAVETEDLLLFVYGGRVTLLQKADLTAGTIDAFRAFISGKIPAFQAVAA